MAHYSTDSVLVPSKRGNGLNVTEEQLFEHKRFMPLAGGSSRQEDGMNSTNTFPPHPLTRR